VITAADPTLPGWLPASDPSFGGKAPAGALFGYNLAEHQTLKNLWPPVPLGQVYFEWNKGTDPAIGGTGVPLGNEGLIIADFNGIWWLSNCYGDVPWPVNFDSQNPKSVSDSDSTSEANECPRDTPMSLLAWFSRANFTTDNTAVLSLHSADPRIKVTCFNTNTPASTGHLQIALDLSNVIVDGAVGFLALKDIDPATGQFKRGPVCEGVYAVSGNVILSSPAQRHLTPSDPSSPLLYQGPVGISVSPLPTLELEVQLVRLDEAEEEFFQDTMFIGLLAGFQQQYRAKLHIPTDVNIVNPQLKLRFIVFGQTAGTLPQLVITGRRVPRPGTILTSSVTLPDNTSEFSITCPTNGVLAANNQYIEAESSPFTVAIGDTVFFTVQRLSTDGYPSEVGIIRQTGILIGG
jgi:hypothetical protein